MVLIICFLNCFLYLWDGVQHTAQPINSNHARHSTVSPISAGTSNRTHHQMEIKATTMRIMPLGVIQQGQDSYMALHKSIDCKTTFFK